VIEGKGEFSKVSLTKLNSSEKSLAKDDTDLEEHMPLKDSRSTLRNIECLVTLLSSTL